MLYKSFILTLCLIWLSSIISFAEPGNNNSLKGRITDEKGEPQMGAVISIPDLKAGAVSDSNGFYRVKNLPAGKYLVQVHMISYGTIVATINIGQETEHNFTLTESAIEKNEVVITGQSKATEIRHSPTPMVAISHQYLQTSFSTNIIDAIAKIPGVSAVTTGPNVSKPFIRGLGYNRILTLYNGMRQEGQQWGDEHGIEVDDYNIDRIEVIKGPASIAYGSDALAGVVNLIPTPFAPDGKTIGNVTAEYQGNNGLIGGSAMASGNHNGFYWQGRISHKEAKNYQDKIDGRVYGTNYNETNATAALGVNRGWGYSHLDMALFDDLQAIPDGSRDSASRKFTKQITEEDTAREIVSDKELNSYSLPTLHQHVQHYRIQSSNSFNMPDGGRLAVNLGFERSVRREFSHPTDGDIPGLYLQLNSYTYDVKYFLPEIKGWDVSFGINGMFQTNDVTQGTEFIIPNYHQFDIGPFLLVKKTFGKLDVTGGVRFDSRSFSNDALYSTTNPVTGYDQATKDTAGATQQFSNYKHTFSGLTYSAGATYSISKELTLKANIARGYRAPNISEISANGVHPGTNIYQLGNPDFKPEFSLQEDIALEYASKHLSFGISLFNNDISNYIYNQKVLNSQGQDSVIVPGNETFRFTAAHAQLYGGELDIDIHPHPLDWLHFENTLSVVYGINKDANNDSGKYLPFIPPLHGTSELRGNFKKPAKFLRNSFVKLQVEYYAKQDRAYLEFNTETPTAGYTLVNFGLGTDIVNRKGNTLFNISVFGNNLFDAAYQSNMSRLKYFEEYPNDPRGHSGIYNMGRNIGVKLSVPLTFK
ncbi:TonB-dependent receptor [Chitinophagaceae bacterium MMS25-I14]